MTLSLLFPIGLTAAAACLLPLLIHLARRSEHRLVMFAALRWLQAKPKPRRKYRFEEILLLLLRLLLLLALALLLAEPVLSGRPGRTHRVLVAPGIDPAAARQEIGLANARWQRLAPGFPLIDDRSTDGERVADESTRRPRDTAGEQPSLSSLLREADAAMPAGTALTVLVPPVLLSADAERPVLSRRVDWRIVAAPDSAAPVAPATAAVPALPVLMVRHSPQRTAPLRYLRAAGEAWMAPEPGTDPATDPKTGSATPAVPAVTIAPASEPIDPGKQHLVWLVPGPLPDAVRDWIIAGGVALLDAETTASELADAAVLWRGPDGPPVTGTRLGLGRIMRLEHDLVPALMPSLVEPDFPIQLQRLLVGQPPLPTRVPASAHAPRTGAADYPEVPRPLAPWLAALVAVLFLIERWVASGPRRSTAA